MELKEIISLHPNVLEDYFTALPKEKRATAILIEDHPKGLLVSYMDKEKSDVISPTSLGLYASGWNDRIAIRIDKFRFASTQISIDDSDAMREAKKICYSIMTLCGDETYSDRVDFYLNNLLLLIEELKVECDVLFDMNNEFQNELDNIMLDEQSNLGLQHEGEPFPELNTSKSEIQESTPKAKTGKRGNKTSKSNPVPPVEEQQQ